jgi:hypothetical protein
MSYVNFTKQGTGTIPTTGWVANTGNYVYKLNYAISNITSSNVVNVIIDKDAMTVAQAAQISPSNDSYNGGITFYANYIPISSIVFSYVIIGGM